jgi:hypothetical protein
MSDEQRPTLEQMKSAIDAVGSADWAKLRPWVLARFACAANARPATSARRNAMIPQHRSAVHKRAANSMRFAREGFFIVH